MFSLLESALCLWIHVHPLWIQGLKRLVLWTQNLTLLEDQGLWIQTSVLHLSCAKAASLTPTKDLMYMVRSIDVGEYRHYFKGFCKNFIYPLSIKKGRTTNNQCVHTNLVQTLSFLLVLSL